MAKRKTLVFGSLGFILLAGVVVVIVLGAMGYFNNKSPSSPTIPGKTTCLAPTITNMTFVPGGQTGYSTFNVEFSPALTQDCIDSLGTSDMTIDLQWFRNGKPFGGSRSTQSYTPGTTSFTVGAQSAQPGDSIAISVAFGSMFDRSKMLTSNTYHTTVPL